MLRVSLAGTSLHSSRMQMIIPGSKIVPYVPSLSEGSRISVLFKCRSSTYQMTNQRLELPSEVQHISGRHISVEPIK
jgi:hypothetical protein